MPNKVIRFLGEVSGIDPLLRRVRHHRIRIENDLRTHILEAATTQLHCSDKMEHALNGPYGRLALVTAMPPSDTGISYFSLRMAKENSGQIDIFTEYNRIDDYYDQCVDNSDITIFPSSLLGVVASRASYDRIVFSVGNSSHNLFVIKRLRSFSKSSFQKHISVEIHDPCCLNLSYRYWGGRLDEIYRRVYADKLGGANFSQEKDLIARGIFGIKALLEGVHVDEIVVHSRRAKEMILEDYGRDTPPTIKVGFHPVFENLVVQANSSQLAYPSVGSFGIPGTSKYLLEKVEAFIRLKRERHVQEAVFAGYHAQEEIKRICGRIPDELTVVADPSDFELAELMASVTVAVQLRRYSLGESSGVVPQLLGYKKPVVCNKVGAFSEYGDAVTYLTEDVTADSIYRSLLQKLQSPQDNLEAVNVYVSQHRSGKLLDLIMS